MPDIIQEGFGTSTPVLMQGSLQNIVARYIRSPIGGRARITAIGITALQTVGGFTQNLFVPIFVLRASSQGFGLGALGVLVRPIPVTSALLGIPGVSDLGSNVELLYTAYIRVGNQGVPIALDGMELRAENGQTLAVVMSPPVDSSAVPPTQPDACQATLSVLGVIELGGSPDNSAAGAFGNARSIPRYDLVR